jgi:hypothetical protein
MQYDQEPIGVLTPLPAKNIDTGLGLNRMALIQQGVPTIFETDQFTPLMALGRELATRTDDERALRILADHSRATTFLIADGVVPSNEDRGYILRRVMRRAIQQGHRIGIEPGFLPRFVDTVIETMGGAYPELHARRQTIQKWVRAEEEGFGRTLEQGTRLLDDLLARGEVKAGETVFCCGPDRMMHAVADLCAARGLRCFLSLETYMACGYGVCNGCTVEVQGPRFKGWPYSRTCMEGPVYDACELVPGGGHH